MQHQIPNCGIIDTTTLLINFLPLCILRFRCKHNLITLNFLHYTVRVLTHKLFELVGGIQVKLRQDAGQGGGLECEREVIEDGSAEGCLGMFGFRKLGHSGVIVGGLDDGGVVGRPEVCKLTRIQ